MRIICQTVRRIANEILGIKGLIQIFQNKGIIKIDKCAYTCSKIQKNIDFGRQKWINVMWKIFLSFICLSCSTSSDCSVQVEDNTKRLLGPCKE